MTEEDKRTLAIIEAAIEKAKMLGADPPTVLNCLGAVIADSIREAAPAEGAKYQLYGVAMHTIAMRVFR